MGEADGVLTYYARAKAPPLAFTVAGRGKRRKRGSLHQKVTWQAVRRLATEEGLFR